MYSKKATDYIESLYAKNKFTQRKYVNETGIKHFPPVIDDDVARMLRVLIMVAKPKKILEIGTSIGFSTVSMAQAMKSYGGKIVTIEINAEMAGQAIENFKREGVDNQVEVKIGDAQTIIANMNDEFDLIFQDVGNKHLYNKLFEDYDRLLRMGGILLAEDTLFPADLDSEFGEWAQMCKSLDAFNKKITDSPQYESTLLPIGDGLTVAVKIKAKGAL